jgi:hypothetical protein
MKNVTFATAMKRKLRLPIIKNHHEYKCKCGKRVDAWGDHSLGCWRNNKTATSNAHRDGLFDIFKKLLPVAKLIQSTGQVEKEIHNIVRSLPTLKPFDVSIRLDHLLSDGAWRTPFARIGFDITLVHSTKPLSLPPSHDETATVNENTLRLRKGESDKFARRTGGTNEVSKRTLSADQVIGEIMEASYSFIPVAIGPFGEIGDIFMRFWDGSANPTPFSFPRERPYAAEAAKRAVSIDTPWNLLGKADDRWREEKGSKPFDGSYLSPLPSIWANQQLGLVCCSQLANHINASFNHLRHDPAGSDEVRLEGDDASLDDLDEPDWNWVEDELMIDDANDFPAVGGSDTCFDGRIHAGNARRKSNHGSR